MVIIARYCGFLHILSGFSILWFFHCIDTIWFPLYLLCGDSFGLSPRGGFLVSTASCNISMW